MCVQTGVTAEFDGFFSWGILKAMGVFNEEVQVLFDSCKTKRKRCQEGLIPPKACAHCGCFCCQTEK